ncbi:hypothetical protein GCM10007920_36090 [Ciceribacter naphthalenivorans]|uniref:Uncharacterized protein n=2 Tax=Alphaproteobacteria TaxID=28211 RepID=A0A512HM41_9HYPH|nr:hypothetical protein RNA01_33920 [Ciceribacter naphthalenivorans]GLR23817.1 hypothetical protein GCM10007920_36090 [Ciceribacter naphthalenivorans]GLT06673.1 hypothetical protein GCM10007926_36090 [Sphingomonas psychrolutea]
MGPKALAYRSGGPSERHFADKRSRYHRPGHWVRYIERVGAFHVPLPDHIHSYPQGWKSGSSCKIGLKTFQASIFAAVRKKGLGKGAVPEKIAEENGGPVIA